MIFICLLQVIYIKEGTGKLETNATVAVEITDAIEFNIQDYKTFKEIPLSVLEKMPFSIYIIDYNWIYLFLNSNSKIIFGDGLDKLIGKSAFDIFSDPKFKPIFDTISLAVDKRLCANETLYSPLRGKQVRIKGYPLDDCYVFYSSILPAKEEVLAELRRELKTR